MPLTGVFNADFSSFYEAVTKAEIQLVSFDSGADKVARTLNRVNEALSGKQVMQEAAAITRVLDNMGGVARLTADEIASIGPKLNEAVAKMKAMGETVPANMQAYADQTKAIGGSLSSVMGIATQLGAVLGVTFSVSGLVQFAKTGLETADAMVKLATETGMSVTEAVKLQTVAAASSVEVQTLSNAVNSLQLNLSKDEGKKAINELGLSFVNLRNESPYEALKDVIEALGRVQDPAERARLANDALGAGWKKVAATMGADWDDLTAGVNRNVDQQIEAANRLKSAMGGMWEQAKINAAENIGAVVLAFEKAKSAPLEFAQAFMKAMQETDYNTNLALIKVGLLEAKIKEAAATAAGAKLFPTVPVETLDSTAKLIKNIGTQTAQQGDIITTASAKAVAEWKKQEEAAKKLSDAHKELASAGTTWQDTLAKMDQGLVAVLTHYASVGVSADALKTAFGATDTQLKAVTASIAANSKALQDEQRDVERTNQLWIQLGQTKIERSGTATERQIADVTRWFNSEVEKLDQSNRNYQNHYTALAALANEKLTGIMVNWEQLRGVSLASLQDTAARAEATYNEALAHQEQYSIETIDGLRKQSDAAQAAVENWNKVGTAADVAGDRGKAAGDKARQAHDDAAAAASRQSSIVDALKGKYDVLNMSVDAWMAKAAQLEADAARNQASGAFGIGWSGSQIAENQRAEAERARDAAARQAALDRTITSQRTSAGAWSINVNAMQGINGDQIAAELVSGMRRRGVSPGGF